MRNFAIWALPAVLVVACSSTSDNGSMSADQACSDAANALCNKINQCSAVFMQLLYGDLATCVSRSKDDCANALSASGTGSTPQHVEACAKAAPGTSCDDALGHNAPSACQAVAGKLANGAPCGDSSQCTSAYCNVAKNNSCGACADPPAAGASCTRDGNCPVGSVCNKMGTCVVPGDSGATCDPNTQPCKSTLACKNGACATPDAAGATCSSNSCSLIGGDFCDPGDSTCKSLTVAAAGQSCGYSGGMYGFCGSGGLCKMSSAIAGTCMAAAADGMSCDATNGPPCMTPAVCQNSVCTRPNPSNCR